MLQQAQVSSLRVGARSAKGIVQPGFKREAHWLKGREKCLQDAHWSGDKFQFSVS